MPQRRTVHAFTFGGEISAALDALMEDNARLSTLLPVPVNPVTDNRGLTAADYQQLRREFPTFASYKDGDAILLCLYNDATVRHRADALIRAAQARNTKVLVTPKPNMSRAVEALLFLGLAELDKRTQRPRKAR